MSTRIKGVVLAGWCACQALTGIAHAADSSEIWPEAQGFVRLDPRTRVFLNAAYAEGNGSDTQSLDLAAYLDISLKPIARKNLQSEDWQRSRYLWARIGYDRVFKASSESGPEVAEDRGIVSVYGKVPLPAGIWLEGRARADLRWIGGDYSTRYRCRLEATREFAMRGRPIVPYFNYEWFYDTRYDAWARALAQLGVEVTLTEHFRYEIFVARQVDYRPEHATLNAAGLVAKWYY